MSRAVELSLSLYLGPHDTRQQWSVLLYLYAGLLHDGEDLRHHFRGARHVGDQADDRPAIYRISSTVKAISVKVGYANTLKHH